MTSDKTISPTIFLKQDSLLNFKMITRKELISSFIEYYQRKDHKEIQNASLVPENDPTVLFTTAGMHPIVPFLLGQKHPQGKRLCNIQRCIRTGDIEEVGDKVHHTFFEMLGKWSVGDYFKDQAIKYTLEFFTKILKIPINKLAVTCFEGDNDSPQDTEAATIWESLGIPKVRIAFLPKKDNWWETPGPGPCGPDTEIFFWTNNSIDPPENFDPNDNNWVEIGNDVLMQYTKTKEGKYIIAKQKNIDFGGGTERILAVLNNFDDNYMTEIWQPIIKEIEKVSGKKYEEKNNKKQFRIIADHIKASVFIIADGIVPSNIDQGYILRRLIRRAIRNLRILGVEKDTNISQIAGPVFEIYKDYQHLQKSKEKIITELINEEKKFLNTLEKGMKVFEKIAKKHKKIPGKDVFLLFQSYGFPVEMTEELAKEKGKTIDLKEYEIEFKDHQELSRTATKGKFSSGLQDDSEKTTRLHTATHLLLASLKKVLNDQSIEQRGSNINQERLRFDFTFERKLTNEELKKIEELINNTIQKGIPVTRTETNVQEAKEQGATGIFDEKYTGTISVYTIGNEKDFFSKEICTGPHVTNTKEIGKFKIIKEESSSSGIRRIKATVD